MKQSLRRRSRLVILLPLTKQAAKSLSLEDPLLAAVIMITLVHKPDLYSVLKENFKKEKKLFTR